MTSKIKKYSKKKIVFIIGSNSMLAKEFVQKYRNNFNFILINRKNIKYKNRYIQIKELTKIYSKHKIYVIFFASNFNSKQSHGSQTCLNLEKKMMNHFIFQFFKYFDVKRFIYISTGGDIYDDKNNFPARENATLNLRNQYHRAKIYCENLLLNIWKDKAICLRVSNVYGSNFHRNLSIGFVDNLVNLKNESFYKPQASVTRDWIHCSDVCMSIFKLLNLKRRCTGIFNVGSGISYNILDIYRFYTSENKLNLEAADGGYCLDTTKIRVLGVQVEDRLKRYLLCKKQSEK